MHPSKNELAEYIYKTLDAEELSRISGHVCNCQFCQEYIEEFMIFLKSKSDNTELPEKFSHLKDTLLDRAKNSNIIALINLDPFYLEGNNLLAADGDKASSGLENIKTFYSKDPEMVLRLMKDHDKDEEFLQLISEDIEMSSNVVIEVPEIDYQCITDNNGKSIIENADILKLAENKWQIKLPEAVFSLEPIEYDPEHTEYSSEVILETESDDRIQVTFEGKTEGKQIILEVLSIDGNEKYGKVKVAIIQDEIVQMKSTTWDNQTVSFHLKDNSAIKIRLFQ